MRYPGLKIIGAIIVIVLLVGIWYVLVQLPYWRGNCGDVRIAMEEYSVDEWGIFKQDYNVRNGTYMIGPQPGMVPVPDVVEEEDCKPVIYFHGDGEMDLTVNVSFTAEDIVTLPEADAVPGGLSWDVVIAGDINDDADDAKVMAGAEAYEYLFYEGTGRYYQNVMARIVSYPGILMGAMEVKVGNIGAFDMEDVYVIGERGGEMRLLHYEALEAGGEINDTVPWSNWTDCSEIRGMLRADLLERDLTVDEAEDLLRYWIDGETDENGMKSGRTLMDPEEGDPARILYFLTEEEYDAKFPLHLSEEPISVNRVGICYVDGIPVHRTI